MDFWLREPDTTSPGLEGYKIDPTHQRAQIMIPVGVPGDSYYGPKFSSDLMVERIMLTRRTVVGPAPYAGDLTYVSVRYQWDVWSDKFGNFIAGPANLVFVEKTFGQLARGAR